MLWSADRKKAWWYGNDGDDECEETSLEKAEAFAKKLGVSVPPPNVLHSHGLLRHCVKGDTFCQEYSLLRCVGQLEHAELSPLDAPVDEGTPTQRDRACVIRLREKEVAWMKELEQAEWRKNNEVANPDVYLTPDEYRDQGMPSLELSKYGDLNTLCAASAVLNADVVSLNEKRLGQQNLAFYSKGKQSLVSAVEIGQRIENPTEVPLLVISHNGAVGKGGHYAACMYSARSTPS